MGELTIANYLGMLQEDPQDRGLLESLRSALGNGAASEDPLRLIEAARGEHERRGEYEAAAGLMRIETDLVHDDPEFRAVLLRELGRVYREELMDDANAAWAYQQLLQQAEEDADAAQALSQIDKARGAWQTIAERFKAEAEDCADTRLKTSLLSRAAALFWQYGEGAAKDEADRLFEEALAVDASYVRAGRLYAQTLRQRERWKDAVAVYKKVAKAARTQDERAGLWLQAARLLRRSLQDEAGAAKAYQQVVKCVAAEPEALGFLVEYFTNAEKWDELIGLYENALRARQRLEDERGVLLQLAMVHWRIRGENEAAAPYFARLRKIDAAHPGMLDYYRATLGTQEQDQSRLLTILGDAQRAAADANQRIDLLKELAQRAADVGQLDRAIESWRSVRSLVQDDGEAHAALQALYTKRKDWHALAELLRGALDAKSEADHEGRLGLLRQLLPIYRDHLHIDAMLVQTEAEIAALAPDDAAVLESLAARYAELGRWNELVDVLRKQASLATDDNEKIRIQLQIATLLTERFANLGGAAQALERVLEIDAAHAHASERLVGIYRKTRDWEALLAVLQKQANSAADAQRRSDLKVQMAQLCVDRLDAPERAIKFWKEVVAESPESDTAWRKLEQLAERMGDWGTMAEVCEQRVAVAPDARGQASALLRLGDVRAQQLSDFPGAIDAWQRILDADPQNSRAIGRMREAYLAGRDWDGLEALYAKLADWDGLITLLERETLRSEDDAQRAELSRRAARIAGEHLADPRRALQSHERLLELQPDEVASADVLLAAYREQESWEDVGRVLEVKYEQVKMPSERVDIADTIARLCLEQLDDAARGFEWAARAFAGGSTRSDAVPLLEQAAEAAGVPEALAQLLEERLSRGDLPAVQRVDLQRRLARLAGEHLGRPNEAIAQLRAILDSDPNDSEAVDQLARLYRSELRFHDLRDLYKSRLSGAVDEAAKVELLRELAELERTGLQEPGPASDRYFRLLDLRPDDEGALRALLELAGGLEQWDRVAIALDGLLRAETSEEERAALASQLGDVQRTRLADADAALAAYGLAVEADDRNETAKVGLEAMLDADRKHFKEAAAMLETLYLRRGEFRELAALLERRLKATDDKREKRTLKLRLAELNASELGDSEGAYRALESAFLDRPNDSELLDRLCGVAAAAGRQDALASALTTAIDAGDLDKAHLIELSRRIAELYDGPLNQPNAAEPFHRRVFDDNPDTDAAFSALKQLYTTQERWSDLQKLYQRRIDVTVDGHTKLDLLLQLCFMYEDILDEPAQAMGAYEQVLELDPTHLSSRRALQRIYADLGQWERLAGLLQRDLDEAQGDDVGELALELGDLFESKLGRPDAALDHFERALEVGTTTAPALEGLERLMKEPSLRQRVAAMLAPRAEEMQAWAQLVRVLHVQLEDVGDPLSRANLYMRIAELQDGKLKDASAAFDACARAVREYPADEAARRRLAALAVASGRLDAQVQELKSALQSTEDDFVKRGLLLELSALWDGPVEDAVQAEAAYYRLLELDPDDGELVLDVSRSLERLHARAQDYPALVEDLQRQAELESEVARRAELYGRLAYLYEEQLEDRGNAILMHERRLEVEPGNLESQTTLERLYESEGHWEQLIDTLRTREAFAEQDEQMTIARKIAGIYEDQLGDRDRAVATYRDLLSRFGADDTSLVALARLHRAGSQWHELLDVLALQVGRAESEGERVGLMYESAELLRTHVDQVGKALETYQAILHLAPGHEPTIATLESLCARPDEPARFDAARMLVAEYTRAEASEERLRALEVLAGSDDLQVQTEALIEAVGLCEQALFDDNRAFEYQQRAVTEAASSGSAGELLAGLQRLATRTDRWADYVHTLERIAPDIVDAELRVETLLRAADTAANVLDAADTAQRLYERVLEEEPDDEAALTGLLGLAKDADDQERVVELLARKATVSADRPARAELHIERARLLEEQLADNQRAIVAYEEALEELSHPRAHQALERLYAVTERWDDLATLYERQIEDRSGDPADARHRLGQLAATRLQDDWRALEQFRDALHFDPSHGPSVAALRVLMDESEYSGVAAEILEPVYRAREAWPDVVAALDARLQVEADPGQRRALLLRLGDVYESKLGDPHAAISTYRKMFLEDPQDPESRGPFDAAARSLERWELLADTYREGLAKIELDDPHSIAICVETAEVYDQKLGNLEQAARCYERAVAFDPGAVGVAAALASVYRRREDWSALLQLDVEREKFADSEADRVEILAEIAAIEAERMGNAAAAIDTQRRILEIDAHNDSAIAALDSLLAAEQRWQELIDHFEYQIDLTEDQDRRLGLRYRVASVTDLELGNRGRAVEILVDVLGQDPRHAQSLSTLHGWMDDQQNGFHITEVLEPLYRESGAHRELVELLEARLAFVDDPAGAASILSEIAELQENQLDDQQAAFDAARRGFLALPNAQDVQQRFDRLAGQVAGWRAYADAYEEALQDLDTPQTQLEAFKTLGRVYDQRLGDPRAAITAYRRQLEVDPDAQDAIDELQMLQTLVGDWQGLAELHELRAGHHADEGERAQLLNQAAQLWEEQMGDRQRALALFERANSEDPDNLVALESRHRLLRDGGEIDRLVEVLQRRVEAEPDVSTRAALGAELARVYANELEDHASAITALLRVCELEPGNASVLAELSELYQHEGRWADLVDNLRERAGFAETADERLQLMHQIGAVLERRLDDMDGAIDAYRSALEIDSGHSGSLDALMRIGKLADYREHAFDVLEPFLRGQQKWDELARLLELRVEMLTDGDAKHEALLSLAEVHELGRDDLNAAFEVLLEAAATRPGVRSVNERAQVLAETCDRWPDYARSLAGQASADIAPSEAATLWTRHAEIAEHRLEDPRQAIASYEQAIAVAGDQAQLLGALARLLEQAEDWPTLHDLLIRQTALEGIGDQERSAVLTRIAVLRRDQLGDAVGALTALREALELDSTSAAALEAVMGLTDAPGVGSTALDVLEDHYTGTHDVAQLVRLYEKRIDHTSNEADALELIEKAATIWEQSLQRADEALRTLRRALVLRPNDDALIERMERLAEAGHWEQLRGLPDEVVRGGKADAATATALRLRASGWYRTHLNDATAAEYELQVVLESHPNDLDAHASRVELLEGLDRPGDLVDALCRWAEAEPVPTRRMQRLERAAEISLSALTDKERAIWCYEAVLGIDRERMDILQMLSELQAGEGNWAAVAESLTRRIELQSDEGERGELLKELGALLADELQQTHDAIEAFERAHALRPQDKSLLSRLQSLYEQAGQPDQELRIAEERMKVESDQATLKALCMRLSELQQTHRGDNERALAYLQQAQHIDPLDQELESRLKKIYHAEQRWDALVALLEGQIESAANSVERSALLRELADVHHRGRADHEAAGAIYRRLLDEDGPKDAVLESMIALQEQAGDFAAAVDSLERLMRMQQGEAAVATAHRMADMAESQLGDVNRTADALRYAYELTPNSEEARQRLEKHYRRCGDYAALAELLKAELDSQFDGERRRHLLRELAALYRDKLGSAAQAAQYLEHAIAAGAERDALIELCDLYVTAGRERDAVPLLKKVIESFANQRSKELAVFHHRLGRAYESQGDLDGAYEQYGLAFQMDVTNVAVLRDRGKLALQRNDLDTAQKSFRGLLLQKLDAETGIAKADVYYYLGEVSTKQGDARKAISMLERALVEDRGHARSAELLARLKGA